MSRGFLSCRHHAGSRIHKISSTRSKIIGDGGGGGGGPQSVRLLVSILLLKRCPNRQDTITGPLRRREGLYKEFLCCIVKILLSIISCKQLVIDP